VPDPRTETIRFRCTPQEVEDFERAAAADQRTVSDWLRFVASRASSNVGPVAPQVLPVRKELYEDALGISPVKKAKPKVRESAPVKKAAADLAEVRREPCRHPVNRRIGNQCAVCYATVGAK
jgi:hypothetical protein